MLNDNRITRDEAIAYLVEHNKNAKDISECITKLNFTDKNGERDYVVDFSPFLGGKYMSSDLEHALVSGQSFTSLQEKQIEQFIIEQEYFRPAVRELVLSREDTLNLLKVIEEIKHCSNLIALNDNILVFEKYIKDRLSS